MIVLDKGSIIFVRNTTGVYGKLIDWYEKLKDLDFDETYPTHTEIYVGDGMVVSAGLSGVKLEYFEKNLKKGKIIWVAEPKIGKKYFKKVEIDIVVETAKSFVGYPYDIWAIISFLYELPLVGKFIEKILPFKFEEQKYAYYCVEVITQAYKSINYFFDKCELISPAHLFKKLQKNKNFELYLLWK